MINDIVSIEWLNQHLNDKNLVILDASQQPNTEKTIIEGARLFDIKNDFSDKSSEFPNTFPSVEQFENSCNKMGINNSDTIVVYDNKEIFSSPRVWWMFKTMGHQNIFVLDGGLPEWEKKYNVSLIGKQEFKTGDFKANINLSAIKAYNTLVENLDTKDSLVIDARSTSRFNGSEKEPRKGLKSGRIPNSINIPYTMVLENGKFKSKAELIALFHTINTEDKPLIFSCGSGITACITLLACNSILSNQKAVYDGSWTEWATKQGLLL